MRILAEEATNTGQNKRIYWVAAMGLEQKLRKIKEQVEKEPVDWIGRRNKWLQQVESLYNDIEKWLQGYVEEGYLTIKKLKSSNEEEHIGEYDIDVLEITIGNYSIMLEPIGTLIIGSFGRVDFYLNGAKFDKYLLLLDRFDLSSNPWTCVEFANKKNRRKLTRQVFESLIENWIA